MRVNLIIFTIFLGVIAVSCNSREIDKDAKDFDNFSFNTMIEERSFGVGYYFTIDSVKYYAKTDNSFVFYPKDFKEQKQLQPNTLRFKNYPIHWRIVRTPFRLIKKRNNDTLIIIKNNKEFIFLKRKNLTN